MSISRLSRRRPAWLTATVVVLVFYLMYSWGGDGSSGSSIINLTSRPSKSAWRISDNYLWKKVPIHYPPASIRPLPTDRPVRFPKVQASKFPKITSERESQRQAIKRVFAKCWASYKEKAWMAGELTPITGLYQNPFGGWGATLVDSLDTLWIMGMRQEFDEAVTAAYGIDFTQSQLEQVNVFETTIRYLGGFLAAYDLSRDARLLRKAVEVGEMLYKAFDTPNRMPVTRWLFRPAAEGERQIADQTVLLAEIGSMTMEFTRLSILTREPKWFDAVQRITDLMAQQQDKTELSGLWPLTVNARDEDFRKGGHFTLGAMADSTYEYLPKMAALLGGTLPQYQSMYEKAMDTATKWLLFRPLAPDSAGQLISGAAHVRAEGVKTIVSPDREVQHLSCYTGGMYALGARLFDRPADLDIGVRLAAGCAWAYRSSPHGVMPEVFRAAACPGSVKLDSDDGGGCEWDELAWKKQVVLDHGEAITGRFDDDLAAAERLIKQERLPEGFTAVGDARYILRPEAIESLFVLYRVTGRQELLDEAWAMFTAIEAITSTELASSAVADVTTAGKPVAMDSMESFWMGETLKYFYLIFSEESLVSLDEWVFNTEAHPFRRKLA